MVLDAVDAQRRDECIEQLRLLDRFEQVRRDAQFTTQSQVSLPIARRQHQHQRLRELRLFANRLRQHEAVRVRHVQVREHD